MAVKPQFQEPASAQGGRHLVRQLRTLSRLGRHTSNLSLAEALLSTMMETHQLLVRSEQQLQELRGTCVRRVKPRRDGPSKNTTGSPDSNWDQEGTLLLKARKLQSK
jgi:hypothetical protein